MTDVLLRPEVVTHGIPTTYRNGCRCVDCTKAWTGYQKAWRKTPKTVKRQPMHGTNERYLLGCRCDKCRRSRSIYTRLLREYPSRGKCVESLTDPNGPAFVRLMHDILQPDDEITAAIRAKIQRRVQKRLSQDYHAAEGGPSVKAAQEISQMSHHQIELLMQPDTPSLAQTQRRIHVRDFIFGVGSR